MLIHIFVIKPATHKMVLLIILFQLMSFISLQFFLIALFFLYRKKKLTINIQCTLRVQEMNPKMLGMVSLPCNPSYSGGGIQEDCGLRPAWEKSL
jgi:hypothetical protein